MEEVAKGGCLRLIKGKESQGPLEFIENGGVSLASLCEVVLCIDHCLLHPALANELYQDLLLGMEGEERE